MAATKKFIIQYNTRYYACWQEFLYVRLRMFHQSETFAWKNKYQKSCNAS